MTQDERARCCLVSVPSSRPCRVYFLETVGEMSESAWVPENAILPFKGGHEFQDLPVLRRRGKQKEKDYKYTVNNLNKLGGGEEMDIQAD